jgi:hypothetical protein
VPRHGIGQQVQRSSAGSIPHDRITILQIRSSRSLPLDRPRQSASRHPPVVTNRPTTYRVRRDPRLIQQPFHHPPACWSASTPFTHLIRGTQIPIAQAATPTSPSRGFLPWRFAYAGPRCRPRYRHGAAIRKPSQNRPVGARKYLNRPLALCDDISDSHFAPRREPLSARRSKVDRPTGLLASSVVFQTGVQRTSATDRQHRNPHSV